MFRSAVFLFAAACSAPGVNGGGQTPAGPSHIGGWHEYRNSEYGFTLRYPTTSTIIEPTLPAEPGVIARVWFQESSVAHSEVARVSPAQFAVDVFDNPSRLTVGDWLATRAIDARRFAREATRVGGVEAVRVTGSAQMAPNVFYYVTVGRFVYRFTPLGADAEQMLASVTFTG